MKTIATVFAAIAAASALLAAPAAQADERVNPYAALPYYGSDHVRDSGPVAAVAKSSPAKAGHRENPFAALPYYGSDHQR